MVGSKLTLKAIFKAKKAKNRTSLEHPYFGCSNEVEILAVLTKLKWLDVLTKLKLKNKFPIVSDAVITATLITATVITAMLHQSLHHCNAVLITGAKSFR